MPGLRLARIGLFEKILNSSSAGRVITVARHINETGHKTPEWIAADEQSHARAFLQLQNAERIGIQFVFADLKQLIMRISVENMHKAAPVMTFGREAHARDNIGDFAPHKRNVARRLGIGFGGEQSDE